MNFIISKSLAEYFLMQYYVLLSERINLKRLSTNFWVNKIETKINVFSWTVQFICRRVHVKGSKFKLQEQLVYKQFF